MEGLGIQLTIDPKLFHKDPESTELGRKIVSKSIEMLEEIGYEVFTFKKLGVEIGSNESSIYRYFHSKHQLLVYLVSWYWSWMEYRLVMQTHSMSDAEERLKTAIRLLTEKITKDDNFSYIDEVRLHQIIVSESSKAYHTKDVDTENQQGFYKTYKRVVKRVSEMVLAVNPNFEYPHMLVSTVIEGAHHQRYFSKHLPSLTDCEEGKNNIPCFFTDLVFKSIR